MEDLIAIIWGLQDSQQMVIDDIKAIKDNQEEMKGMTEGRLERMLATHEKTEAVAKHYTRCIGKFPD
jgi:hypothetical protein